MVFAVMEQLLHEEARSAGCATAALRDNICPVYGFRSVNRRRVGAGTGALP
jgi:hypothetical protein